MLLRVAVISDLVRIPRSQAAFPYLARNSHHVQDGVVSSLVDSEQLHIYFVVVKAVEAILANDVLQRALRALLHRIEPIKLFFGAGVHVDELLLCRLVLSGYQVPSNPLDVARVILECLVMSVLQ